MQKNLCITCEKLRQDSMTLSLYAALKLYSKNALIPFYEPLSKFEINVFGTNKINGAQRSELNKSVGILVQKDI